MAHQKETGSKETTKPHVLISHADADITWAEWIAWQLEDIGCKTILEAWDFRPGSNRIYELHKATAIVDYILPLFSRQYLHNLYMHPEWTAAFRENGTNEEKRLIPIRIEACNTEGFLENIVTVDIFQLDETRVRLKLSQAIKGERQKRRMVPRFPGREPHHFGRIPRKNDLFVGREEHLKAIHKSLQNGAIVALTPSLGTETKSVGKTQIATEYVYRYQSNYECVLWIEDNPENSTSDQLIQDIHNIEERLRLVNSSTTAPETIRYLRQWLETNTDWLLILDGVKNTPIIHDLHSFQHTGNVLLTTRDRSIASTAHLIEVNALSSEEKDHSNRLKNLIDASLRSPEKQHLPLSYGEHTIGRALDNTLRCDEPSVSEHHARLLIKEDASYIIDLNSESGTFVDGQRLVPRKPHRLAPKAHIFIGNLNFVFAPEARRLTVETKLGKDQITIAENSPPSLTDSTTLPTGSKENTATPIPLTDIPLLPRIDDMETVLEHVRQGNKGDQWHIFRSEIVSFQDFRILLFNLYTVYKWAFHLTGALAVFNCSLLVALAVDDSGSTTPYLLFTLFVSTLATIWLFSIVTIEILQQGPALQMTPSYPEAYLVITENGFVEYIDASNDIDCVSFADLAYVQQCGDEEDLWLDLFYRDGRKGQWNQRAHFGPSKHILQIILEAYIQYIQQHLFHDLHVVQ